MLSGPIEAAMVNGVLANADETDDNYSTGGAHPGCAVVPAALAIGEKNAIDGTRFIRRESFDRCFSALEVRSDTARL